MQVTVDWDVHYDCGSVDFVYKVGEAELNIRIMIEDEDKGKFRQLLSAIKGNSEYQLEINDSCIDVYDNGMIAFTYLDSGFLLKVPKDHCKKCFKQICKQLQC